MTIDDGAGMIPAVLSSLSGIAKAKLLDFRRRRVLGLVHSDDEPIRSTFSRKIVELDDLLWRLNGEARRVLGPQKAPEEKRYR